MAQKQKAATYDAGHVPITEEFDSAAHNLPSATPVIAAFLIVGVLLGGYFYFARAKPYLTGSVVKATINPVHIEANASGVVGQMGEVEKRDAMVVLLQISLKNIGDKPLWIRSINATVTPEQGDPITDQPAISADLDRLFQAYPKLAPSRIEPLLPDEKLDAGTEKSGMIVVNYPLSPDAFGKRKGFVVSVEIHNKREPLIMNVPPYADTSSLNRQRPPLAGTVTSPIEYP